MIQVETIPPTVGEEIQRLTHVAYRTGVEAGHADAVVYLEELVRTTWLDLQVERRIRNRSHRELTDYAVFERVVVARRGVLRELLQIRRALKEGAHR